MGTTDARIELNGMDAASLREFAETAAADASRADREPTVVARWAGGDAAEVTDRQTGAVAKFGGASPSAMRILLMSLAACDVDVIATRATLMGLELDDVTVEATGHFNVRRYVGVDSDEGPGYQRIAYRVVVRAPGATPDQLAELRRACEAGSPVGDSLGRAIPLELEFDAG